MEKLLSRHEATTLFMSHYTLKITFQRLASMASDLCSTAAQTYLARAAEHRKLCHDIESGLVIRQDNASRVMLFHRPLYGTFEIRSWEITGMQLLASTEDFERAVKIYDQCVVSRTLPYRPVASSVIFKHEQNIVGIGVRFVDEDLNAVKTRLAELLASTDSGTYLEHLTQLSAAEAVEMPVRPEMPSNLTSINALALH